MKVKSIMIEKVLKVRMDDSIGTICNILEHVEFHHLLVVKGRELVGILSDRNVLRVISPFLGTLSEEPRDMTLLTRKIHQIMTRKPITVDKDTSIGAAASLLLDNNISCLPVVSPKGWIDGIVTWRDILRFYVKGNGTSNQRSKDA
jgi:acetoin utilization protein AcuB